MEMKKITVSYKLRTPHYEFLEGIVEMYISEAEFEEFVKQHHRISFQAFHFETTDRIEEHLRSIAKISGYALNSWDIVEVRQEVKRRDETKGSKTFQDAVMKELWS